MQDGSPAYVIRRFDRTTAGAKLRCEDFAQILGADDKYRGSIEQIGRKLKELSTAAGLDAQLLFERVLLNFLLGNGDAHLKNFSMLETDQGGLRLSPAYDIVCSKAVIPREMDCALTINSKQNKIGRGDMAQLAETLAIPRKPADRIVDRFHEGRTMMLEAVQGSRLSALMREKVQRVIEERHHRLFGT